MKSSVKNRIKVTKKGKLLRRRKMGQSHSRAKQTNTQKRRKKGMRSLNIKMKNLNNF